MMIATDADAGTFNLEEGWICLDFANTGIVGREIEDVGDLIDWARGVGLISRQDAERLGHEANAAPTDADHALSEAHRQRRLIRHIFGAVGSGDAPREADLQALNELLNEALSELCLVPTETGYVLGWTEWSAVDCVLWPVVKSTVDLLCSEERQRVGQCAAEDCAWLFLDTSKNRSRRWCSMQRCGNRAKVRRYLDRQRS